MSHAGRNKPTEHDIQNVQKYFRTILTKDKRIPVNLQDCSIDELLDCIKADNPVERIAYRR